jgi:starvation-inducible DNA-binding protein
MHRVSNGLSTAENKKSHEALRDVLASTFILYTKTLSFHWHVSGPHFVSYHTLLEEQYNDLFSAIDMIAERIRSIGHIAPSGCQEMLGHSTIKESEANLDAESMLSILTGDHFHMVKLIREKIKELEAIGDHASADMLIARLAEHEKMAWFLQSHLL